MSDSQRGVITILIFAGLTFAGGACGCLVAAALGFVAFRSVGETLVAAVISVAGALLFVIVFALLEALWYWMLN